MKLKRLIISFVIMWLALQPIFTYSQDVGGNTEEINNLNQEIADRKQKIKELEDSIERYKKTIEQKQLEASSLKNQLGILDNHIAKAEADIELTEEKIDQAQLEIEALELSIQDKNKVMDRQKKIVANIVRSINTDQNKNYLEILLTNNTFADFYNQVQYKTSVYTDLGKSVKILRLVKEDLEGKKAQVVEKRTTFEKLKMDLEEKKDKLDDQAKAKQDLLVQTKSSELKYRTLLSSLKQQYQSTENEIRSYEDLVRKKLEEQKKLSEDVGDFFWPVTSRVITSYFRDKDYPFRNVFEHNAIDIRASQGTPVKATASGYVARARKCTLASCYSYVLLVHTDDLSSLYGHLSSIVVKADQFVHKGDIIGYSGGTPGTVGAGPFVTGPHLHFEIRKNGIPTDPLRYVKQ